MMIMIMMMLNQMAGRRILEESAIGDWLWRNHFQRIVPDEFALEALDRSAKESILLFLLPVSVFPASLLKDPVGISVKSVAIINKIG